jgi:hypothetical protein
MSSYDAVANFSTTMNPNGVWSYGELPSETAVSAFSVYPTEGALDFGATGWSTGSGSPPYVGVNNTGSPITGRGVTLPSGDLAMHPGASGEYSDTRFTVPGAGPVSATFTFAGLETGTSTDVHVLYNGTSMADGTIAGYSTFSNTISIPAAAAGDTLDFVVGYGSDQSYIGDATSLTAQVTASGNKLAFIQSPSDTAVNAVIKPPITVEVEDSNGNFQTTASDSVTLGIQSGSGTLKGTLTEPAINGLATFSDLSIDQSGDYFLKATDTSDPNTDSGVSNQFKITAGKLMFAPEPTNGSANSPLKTIKVELKDDKNKLITNADGTVVKLGPSGVLSGNPISGNTAVLSGGVATFSNVVLQKPGTYQLQADDGADAVATSVKFKVTGNTLAFLTQPTDTATNEQITVRVGVKTSTGKIATASSSVVELQSLNTISGGGLGLAALTLPTYQTVSAGIATFTFSVPAAGKYTITTAAIDPTMTVPDTDAYVTDDSVTPATSKSFKVLGPHLVFLTPPKTTDVNSNIVVRVAVEDGRGKIDTSSSAALQLQNLKASTPISTLGLAGFEAPAYQTVSNGVATFTFSVPVTGTFTITAVAVNPGDLDDATGEPSVDPGVIASTSKPFQILGLHLAIMAQPTTVAANTAFALRVAVENSKGQLDTDSTAPIQLANLQSQSGGGLGLAAFEYPPYQLSSGGVTTVSLIIPVAGTYKITVLVLDLEMPDSNGDGGYAVDSSVASATSKLIRVR